MRTLSPLLALALLAASCSDPAPTTQQQGFLGSARSPTAAPSAPTSTPSPVAGEGAGGEGQAIANTPAPTATNPPPTATQPPPTNTPVPPTNTPPPPPPLTPTSGPQPSCDPNYTGACIPIVSYDLDCPDVGVKNFRSVGSDPHRFDGDNDGIGCEG